jgi:two-component system sensor histidine kinase KdpD
VRLVNEAAQRQRLVSNAIVDVIVDTDDLRARADVGRVGQVLDNVLGNAIKFSPPGSSVEVLVRRSGDDVVISITDQGPGLMPEDVDRVFERYYRGRTTASTVPGLGVGLALSREIVEAHGGRIWAESAGPGKGSTFSIALPASTGARVPAS